jgi:hypothetical protein
MTPQGKESAATIPASPARAPRQDTPSRPVLSLLPVGFDLEPTDLNVPVRESSDGWWPHRGDSSIRRRRSVRQATSFNGRSCDTRVPSSEWA